MTVAVTLAMTGAMTPGVHGPAVEFRRTVVGFEVFDSLDRDWGLLLRSGAARGAMATWQGDPALGRYQELGELIPALRSRTLSVADKDQILAALARRAASDDVAARTLLQAIVPGLINVAKRLGAFDADRHAELVGEAFALVRCYPIERRPRAVAANLCWDTFSRLARSWRTAVAVAAREAPLEECEQTASAEPGFECVEVRDAITRVVAARHVRPGDVELVLRVGDDGERVVDRARTEGRGPEALQKCVERARRRLAHALRSSYASAGKVA